MRLALSLVCLLLLAACVPTADFRDLRAEVRQLEAENQKLKEEQNKKLEALEKQVEGIRITQQGFDQKLGELLRQADEAARKAEAPRAGDGQKALGQITIREPKADTALAPPPQAGVQEQVAMLTPTASYNQAYNDYLKGNYDLAISGFEDFLVKYPGTSLTAHAQYWIGEAHYNKKAYSQAIEAYARLIANYPKSDKVAPAMAKSGFAYAEMGNTVKARDMLKQVIERYPQSAEASLAKRRLADFK